MKGSGYKGKGSPLRMLKSETRLETIHADKVKIPTHFPTSTSRGAFIKEYQLIKETGELRLHWDPFSKLYNKIWSPGKKLAGE